MGGIEVGLGGLGWAGVGMGVRRGSKGWGKGSDCGSGIEGASMSAAARNIFDPMVMSMIARRELTESKYERKAASMK